MFSVLFCLLFNICFLRTVKLILRNTTDQYKPWRWKVSLLCPDSSHVYPFFASLSFPTLYSTDNSRPWDLRSLPKNGTNRFSFKKKQKPFRRRSRYLYWYFWWYSNTRYPQLYLKHNNPFLPDSCRQCSQTSTSTSQNCHGRWNTGGCWTEFFEKEGEGYLE